MSCRCERPGWLEGHDPGCPYEDGKMPWFEVCISELQTEIIQLKADLEQARNAQVPTEIRCPQCNLLHVDQDEWATTRLHRKHLCHGCGNIWQPYPVTTTGCDFHDACRVESTQLRADTNWLRAAWETEIEENKKLTVRRDELLAMVAKLSQTVPLDSEVAEALTQRGTLLAEVGTLKARVVELESMLAAQPGTAR